MNLDEEQKLKQLEVLEAQTKALREALKGSNGLTRRGTVRKRRPKGSVSYAKMNVTVPVELREKFIHATSQLEISISMGMTIAMEQFIQNSDVTGIDQAPGGRFDHK